MASHRLKMENKEKNKKTLKKMSIAAASSLVSRLLARRSPVTSHHWARKRMERAKRQARNIHEEKWRLGRTSSCTLLFLSFCESTNWRWTATPQELPATESRIQNPDRNHPSFIINRYHGPGFGHPTQTRHPTAMQLQRKSEVQILFLSSFDFHTLRQKRRGCRGQPQDPPKTGLASYLVG